MLEVEDRAKGTDLVYGVQKYHKTKVLMFILIKRVGLTLEGEPCEARFLDRFSNMCIHHVTLPQIVSNYFKHCNVIDSHNQVRQLNLSVGTRG